MQPSLPQGEMGAILRGLKHHFILLEETSAPCAARHSLCPFLRSSVFFQGNCPLFRKESLIYKKAYKQQVLDLLGGPDKAIVYEKKRSI